MEGIERLVVEDGELFRVVRTAEVRAAFEDKVIAARGRQADDFCVRPGDDDYRLPRKSRGDFTEGGSLVHLAKVVRANDGQCADETTCDQRAERVCIGSAHAECRDQEIRASTMLIDDGGNQVAQNEVATQGAMRVRSRRWQMWQHSACVRWVDELFDSSARCPIFRSDLVKTIARERELGPGIAPVQSLDLSFQIGRKGDVQIMLH